MSKHLMTQMARSKARKRVETRHLKKARCSNVGSYKATKGAVLRHLMTQMARSKAWYMVETRGRKKIAVLTLGLLEGDD